MHAFDFQQRTRFVCAPGSISKLGALARELGARRALIVSDAGVVRAGHFERGRQALLEQGIEVGSFHDFQENPSTEHVEQGVQYARQFAPDLLIGLGGGSSMDCAKGVNFVYSCGGKMQDYWGVGKAGSPMLPMIAVPTTSGTGSEAQSFALISDAVTHVKMACGDPKAACKIAILDPELTVTQPQRVTALTGIDAISHALETYVTKRRTTISAGFGRQSWKLLASSFERVLDHPLDIDARSSMQVGACMAGMAIEASMLGAAHATANPLTAQFGVTHGQAIALMLPHVIRFNGEQYGALYHELWSELYPHEFGISSAEATERLASFVSRVAQKAGLEIELRKFGIEPQHIPSLTEDAMKQWTGTFNPRSLNTESIHNLYQQAI